MDRALEDIIRDRPQRDNRERSNRSNNLRRAPDRDGSRDSGPRDGIRKQYNNPPPRDARNNLDREWVHDRYDDRGRDSSRRNFRSNRDDYDDRSPDRRQARQGPAELKVENIHFDLTEADIRELFSRIGAVASVRFLYDRQDRPKGIAFVKYSTLADAEDAVKEFDGANAYNQPIRVKLVPSSEPFRPSGRNPFDNVEIPTKSLFDRIDKRSTPESEQESREPRRRDDRSRRDIDRYEPRDRRERSPMRKSQGQGRENGRRPGQRNETQERNGRGGRGPKPEENRRRMVGGRPQKTTEELDAEMAQYWNNKDDASNQTNTTTGTQPTNGNAGEVDMMVE